MADYLQDNIEPEEIYRPARKRRKSGIGALIMVVFFVVLIGIGIGVGIYFLTENTSLDYSGEDYSNVEVPDTSVPLDGEEITIEVPPQELQE